MSASSTIFPSHEFPPIHSSSRLRVISRKVRKDAKFSEIENPNISDSFQPFKITIISIHHDSRLPLRLCALCARPSSLPGRVNRARCAWLANDILPRIRNCERKSGFQPDMEDGLPACRQAPCAPSMRCASSLSNCRWTNGEPVQRGRRQPLR